MDEWIDVTHHDGENTPHTATPSSDTSSAQYWKSGGRALACGPLHVLQHNGAAEPQELGAGAAQMSPLRLRSVSSESPHDYMTRSHSETSLRDAVLVWEQRWVVLTRDAHLLEFESEHASLPLRKHDMSRMALHKHSDPNRISDLLCVSRPLHTPTHDDAKIKDGHADAADTISVASERAEIAIPRLYGFHFQLVDARVDGTAESARMIVVQEESTSSATSSNAPAAPDASDSEAPLEQSLFMAASSAQERHRWLTALRRVVPAAASSEFDTPVLSALPDNSSRRANRAQASIIRSTSAPPPGTDSSDDPEQNAATWKARYEMMAELVRDLEQDLQAEQQISADLQAEVSSLRSQLWRQIQRKAETPSRQTFSFFSTDTVKSDNDHVQRLASKTLPGRRRMSESVVAAVRSPTAAASNASVEAKAHATDHLGASPAPPPPPPPPPPRVQTVPVGTARGKPHIQMSSLTEENLALISAGDGDRQSAVKAPVKDADASDRPSVKTKGEHIKIWVGSWNMGAKEMTSVQQKDLASIIPEGYDLYVFGVQECLSDIAFEVVSRRLQRTQPRCQRMKLDCLVWGRGDGSFISPKFTGVELYVSARLAPFLRVLGSVPCSLGLTEGSKGGAAFAIKVMDTTFAFVCAHLSATSVLDRRTGYGSIVESSGNALGEPYFQLLEQFHHTIFFGDLNYRTKDASANMVFEWIGSGNLKTMHSAAHDQLMAEMQAGLAFAGFREPVKSPSFLPTYKKLEDRKIPTDYTDPQWVGKVYRARYKEPWYKSGQVVDRVPSYCDRVLYHSLHDMRDRLAPEEIEDSKNGNYHNYNAVNEKLSGSDHSAVTCGFRAYVVNCMPSNITSTSYIHYTARLTLVRILDERAKLQVPVRYVRILFPGPFEDQHDSPSSTQIQAFDVGRSALSEVSWTGVQLLPARHFLLKVKGRNGISGQCSVALPQAAFLENQSVAFTKYLLRNGSVARDPVSHHVMKVRFILELRARTRVSGRIK